jgi:RNA polymerase sigma-70 factor (ECF subfamily)
VTLSPEREAELVEAARRARGPAREAATRELYEGLRPRVWALCVRLCGDRQLAEDAMQDAFFNVFRNLHAFRGEARLSTYLYRVAVREALAHRARRLPTGPIEEAAELASPAPPPDALAADRQRAERTQRAFRTLSPAHQTVLSLFAIEGLSHKQIAQVLGIPEGTVWYRLHESRKALSEKVAKMERPKVFEGPGS